ncbi:unnamed protein product [Camellia sinensis]
MILLESQNPRARVDSQRQGESCNSVCKSNGQSSVPNKLSMLNQCEMVWTIEDSFVNNDEHISLGATRDPELLRRIGDATALEVRATGIPYVFAPCIAVCRDPRWGRCYESYSEDPKIVREMTDIILGLQGENPNSSLKGVPYVAGRATGIPRSWT